MYKGIRRNERKRDQIQRRVERARRAARRRFEVRPSITDERNQQLGQFSSLLDTHLMYDDQLAFQIYQKD